MFNSRDPKTTATGIILILIGIVSWLFGIGFIDLFYAVADFNLQAVLTVVLPLLSGIGLLGARDNNKDRR